MKPDRGTSPELIATVRSCRYAAKVSALFDELYWSWSPGKYSEELENSMLELLVAANEDLMPLFSQMSSMSSMMDGGDVMEMVQQLQVSQRMARAVG